MSRDRHPGRFLRARRRPQTHLFIFRDLPLAGRALDNPRFDSGVVDPAVDLADINRRDIVNRPLLEVRSVAEVFLVEPGRADYSHPRRGRHFGHKVDVAPDIHRTWIDKSLEPKVAHFLQALDADLERRFPLELR